MNKIIEKDCADIISRVDFSTLKNKKILVTGATGFIGQYLVSALSLANRKLKLGASIHAVGLNEPRSLLASVLKEDKAVSYERVDLSKPFVLKNFDYIFHSAGYGQPAKFVDDPSSLVRINIDATIRLLEGSPKSTFVFFSSAEIYGEIPPEVIPVKESFNGNCFLHTPRSVYGEAKRLGEALSAAYERKLGNRVRIVRISHVYGPGLPPDDRRVMSEFISKGLKGNPINLLDDGAAIKTYGYIGDVVSMIFHAALHGKEMVYNVGGKDSVSILDLAKKIGKYCKVKTVTPGTSSKLSHIGKEPTIVRLDLTKITTEMKKFIFTPFDEGLKRTIEWSIL